MGAGPPSDAVRSECGRRETENRVGGALAVTGLFTPIPLIPHGPRYHRASGPRLVACFTQAGSDRPTELRPSSTARQTVGLGAVGPGSTREFLKHTGLEQVAAVGGSKTLRMT